MSTFSEEIKARYNKSESEIDSFDRLIVVKRMKPSEMLAVRRIADSDRQNINLDAVVAGCVRTVDSIVCAPVKTQDDLDSILDLLQPEGLRAAGAAWARLMGFTADANGTTETVEEKAQNLPVTPS